MMKYVVLEWDGIVISITLYEVLSARSANLDNLFPSPRHTRPDLPQPNDGSNLP